VKATTARTTAVEATTTWKAATTSLKASTAVKAATTVSASTARTTTPPPRHPTRWYHPTRQRRELGTILPDPILLNPLGATKRTLLLALRLMLEHLLQTLQTYQVLAPGKVRNLDADVLLYDVSVCLTFSSYI
jgi:hypothetical protein